MKKLILVLGLWLGALAPSLSPAVAQNNIGCGVNVNPQVGIICDTIKKNTYSAAAVNLVPASAATDIFCISGSTSKSISLKTLTFSGIETGTTVAPIVSIIHHAVLDTGGTGASGLAAPVAVANNPSNVAATAVLSAFTANPTINDTNPLTARAVVATLASASSLSAQPQYWLFGSAGVDEYAQGLDIPKGVTGQYCLNLGGVTITASATIDLSWTEN